MNPLCDLAVHISSREVLSARGQKGSKLTLTTLCRVSVEKSLADGHDIVVNGYNLGRDYLVGNFTNQSTVISTPNVTNQTTCSGNSAYGNWTYNTKVNYVSGLLQNTSSEFGGLRRVKWHADVPLNPSPVGINHNIT